MAFMAMGITTITTECVCVLHPFKTLKPIDTFINKSMYGGWSRRQQGHKNRFNLNITRCHIKIGLQRVWWNKYPNPTPYWIRHPHLCEYIQMYNAWVSVNPTKDMRTVVTISFTIVRKFHMTDTNFLFWTNIKTDYNWIFRVLIELEP